MPTEGFDIGNSTYHPHTHPPLSVSKRKLGTHERLREGAFLCLPTSPKDGLGKKKKKE